MRALWTGASGMMAQQTNLDTIANNFSNVNTAGYKKEQAQFASLLYQKIQRETTDAEGRVKPVIGQVGSGVRTSGIVSIFTQGNLQKSGSDWHMALEGNGMFMVQDANGQTAYTRNGSFGLNIGENGVLLSNTDGFPVLDTTGQPIEFDITYDVTKIKVDDYGNIMYPDENNVLKKTGVQIGIAQFNNPSGLLKTGGSLCYETPNSGVPRLEAEEASLKKSKVISGYLEASNVDTANEVVNLIVAQRAYEMNSKAITAADEMLQQANNLRG